MSEDFELRSFRALRAYVTGESSEPNVFSDLRGVPREEIHRVLRRHRAEFDAIDPGRSVILESIV